ncbi:MAG: hypothetical protein H0V79_07090 [Actinobacteria bacterium]|nr:hypothetical protein [Actinomycetota bacterium]MBA3737699.1 hypothetical protein [Actinomycetota bacterium]
MPAIDAPRIEDLLRELASQVLGALTRRHGQFDACEDAVQDRRAPALHCTGPISPRRRSGSRGCSMSDEVRVLHNSDIHLSTLDV